MATAYDAFGVRWTLAKASFRHGAGLIGIGDLLQCGALVIPALGMTVTSARVGRRLGGAALAWSASAPMRRVAVATTVAAVAGGAAYTWVPSGDYRPIQAGSPGTTQARTT